MLVACVALILSAGVLAVTTSHPPAPVRVGSLNPTGFREAEVSEEPTVGQSAAPAVSAPATVTPPSSVTTAVVRRATTATTAPSLTRESTNPTQRSTPPETAPTTSTTITTVPRAASWSASQNGIGLRLRMEPATPKAGEPVTFLLELSPIDNGCCIGALSFGDETGTPLAFETGCKYGPGAVQRAAATHAFATAGAYRIVASAATVPCSAPSPAGDGSLLVMGFPVGVTIDTCVVIGPSQAQCTP